MATQTIKPVKKFQGTLKVPGDKSISHRALILGSLCEGDVAVSGLLESEDVGRTRTIMQELGVAMEEVDGVLNIRGRGLKHLQAPDKQLYCGNSGTTLRLMTGLLAGQSFQSELNGDASLNQRPMGRVIEPLKQMGAKIEEISGVPERQSAGSPTSSRIIRVTGSALKGIDYKMPVASAQVKSAILLAGLYASEAVTIHEPYPSRDHSERMLLSLGAPIETGPAWVSLHSGAKLTARDIQVPGDFSSAAFFLVAALLLPDSEVRIEGVSINPTRTGLLDLLRTMGGKIEIENDREMSGEPVADLVACTSELRGASCPPELVPRLIDEIPILAIAAARAEGTTRIWGAKELRVKESDRIKALATELAKLGVAVSELEDGLEINGPTDLQGAALTSYGDHRMAMSLAVAGALAKDPVTIEEFESVAISYPGFLKDWESLSTSG